MENNKITSVSFTINTKQTNKTQQDCSPHPPPKIVQKVFCLISAVSFKKYLLALILLLLCSI